MRTLKFDTLDDAVAELKRLERLKNVNTTGKWSFYQILNHCAESIEIPVINPAQRAPWLLRRTIGRLIIKGVWKAGFMKPGIPNPSAPKKREEGDVSLAFKRIYKAIDSMKKAEKFAEEHPFFGHMTHQEWITLQRYHMANHLGFVEG
ncbi:MAG: DUF1569 domain-containing protein [Spirochaetia bacterium]|nr:DUF1569 domain-containing protein [Spirochaetia bacterium]